MDALQRDTAALLRDALEVEDSFKTESFVRLKSALKAVKDIPGVDERFVAQQVDRLKNEVKRLAVQQNKLRAWKRVLETVDQNQELAAALKRALGKAPGQDDNEEEEDEEATRRRIKTEGPGPVELPDMAAILGGKFTALSAELDQPLEENHLWNEFLVLCGEKKRGGDDDELEVMATQQDDRFALKCPITQQLYEKPMKNSNCQHVYSHAGIYHALKNKQQARCPVPGCNAVVTRATLEADKEKEYEVTMYKRREQGN